MKNKLPVVTFLDIETSANVIHAWGIWEQNALKVVKPWEILSFSVEVNGKKRTRSRRHFKDKTDESLVRELFEVFEKSDIIIGHNIDKFDVRKSNTRFEKYNLGVPSEYTTVDTLKLARKYFAFNSNKLDDLGEFLGLGRKKKTGGYPLWDACMQGLLWAFKKMEKYNAQDVVLLKRVYRRLLKWHKSHPNMTLYKKEKGCGCPNCGSDQIISNGNRMTKSGSYTRFRCKSCGHHFKGKTMRDSKKKAAGSKSRGQRGNK